MDKLQQSLLEQKQQTEPISKFISGLLGIPLGGQKRIEVPNRKAYVFVRLRANQSEVIQAYNNKVATSYGLPVLVERQGNRYVVVDVDTKRYDNNWASQSPFLPRHGNTHSFDLESGGGGDVVWVQSRQIVPLLALPSGSSGAGNVIINPYILKNSDGSWKYVGSTGTASLLPYRPTSPTGAVMALIYLDAPSGNPFLIVNSGTVFSNSITGSSQIVRFIPSVPDASIQIPIAAIRLITGTSALSWDNIYDVRQWLHTVPTGSSTGGGSISTGVLDARYLKLDASNDPLTGALVITVPTFVPLPENDVLKLNTYSSETFTTGLRINATSGSIGEFISAFNNYALRIQQTLNEKIIATQAPVFIERFSDDGDNNFSLAPIIDIDESNSFTPYGGTIRHVFDGTTIFGANPQATGTVTPYIFDTQYPKPTGTIFISVRHQTNEIFRIDVSGTAYSNNQALIREAPVDGNLYSRKNAGWEAIAISASGSVGVSNTGSYVGQAFNLDFQQPLFVGYTGTTAYPSLNGTLLVTEDVSIQQTGTATHFNLAGTISPLTDRFFYNGLRQKRTTHYSIDVNGRGFTTVFTGTVGDNYIMEYGNVGYQTTPYPIGFLPFVFPFGVDPTFGFTSATNISINGGSVAVPVHVSSPMKIASVSVKNTNTSAARSWRWDLYYQLSNAGLSSEKTLIRAIGSNGSETFTAGGASVRTLAASSNIIIPAGLYWIVIQNTHASNTFGLGVEPSSGVGIALDIYQSKTTSNPNGDTLDFSTGWTRNNDVLAIRLNGIVFGEAVAF